MSVKSLRTQLLGAIAMVLVATLALGSSTFAWFSMNNSVSVTGMSVKTEVKNNLLIADSSNKPDSGTYDKLVNQPTPSMPALSDYKTYSIQTKSALLEPVSTTSAAYNDFWYTSTRNVLGTGNAKSEVYYDYDTEGLAQQGTTPKNVFNTNYGTTGAVGYIDYVFALQAQKTDAGAKYINMTKCNLHYAGEDTTSKAFRVAVLVQDGTDGSAASTDIVSNITILGCKVGGNDSAYFDGTTAVKSASTLDSVTHYNTAATIATIADDFYGTKFYKVTVRLWLEGEDDTCNNKTFAQLTGDYSLDLEFQMQSVTTEAVTYVTKDSIPANNYQIASTATSSTTKYIGGVQYYEYTATLSTSGTATIYGTANAANADGIRWYIPSSEAETGVFDITYFVKVATP